LGFLEHNVPKAAIMSEVFLGAVAAVRVVEALQELVVEATERQPVAD
jgi:hypothetical protein